jgi:hypothetical protein
MLTNLLRRVRGERGMALPLALGTLTALTATAMVVLGFSTTNSKNADRDKGGQLAFALAEAGLNNTLAVLNNPTNNALKQQILPACSGAQSTWNQSAYEGGTVSWCGTLAIAQSAWNVTSTGTVRNMSSGTKTVTRTISAYVPVTPVVNQVNNNPAWNYVMSTATGSECDMTVNENILFESALFVHGSLCLDNNADIRVGPLIVKGTVRLDNNGSIGTSAARIQVAVGGINRDADAALELCKEGSTNWNDATAEACGDSDRIYATPSVSTTPPTIAKPAAEWDAWYQDAMPGPMTTCTAASGASSGTVPVFDNDAIRNNSVASNFNLTPAASYTCRVGPATNPIGELSWNHSTRVLSLRGVVFIDGGAYSMNGLVNTYDGQGTLYLSGTFLLDNNTKICASVSGSNCNFAGWNPNSELLSIITNGSGGQVPVGYGTHIDNGAQIQAALYATNGVMLSNNASTDGPILGSTVTVGQNFTGDDFGTIISVPPGMPGNPEVYAQPNPPQRFSG